MIQTQTQRNKPTANRNAIADESWDVEDSHSCRAHYYNYLDLEPATAFLPSARTSRSLDVPRRKHPFSEEWKSNTRLVDHEAVCFHVDVKASMVEATEFYDKC